MSDESNSLGGLIIGLFLLLVLGVTVTSIKVNCGVDGFGSYTEHRNAKVISKHVDMRGGKSSASHYMVTTDKGVFEVQNGWFLGMWNADEIYGRLEVGREYNLTTKGNKSIGWIWQYYPYVTQARLTPEENFGLNKEKE